MCALVTGVQTCALPIWDRRRPRHGARLVAAPAAPPPRRDRPPHHGPVGPMTALDSPTTGAAPEIAPLRIGPLTVNPPVVLAPMAGVTDAPFRGVCSRYGAGLYVSEMITARALIERRSEGKTSELQSLKRN